MPRSRLPIGRLCAPILFSAACLLTASPGVSAAQPTVVTVILNSPDASAAEMDSLIAAPLSLALKDLPQAVRVEIESTPGRCSAVVRFGPGTEADPAKQAIQARVERLIPTLPAGCDAPIVMSGDPGDLPTYWIAVQSGQMSLAEVSDIARRMVRDRLVRLPNVAGVEVVGGVERTPTLWLDSSRLAQFKLTAGDVQRAIEAAADIDVQNLGDFVIASANGVAVRAKDLGRIEETARADSFACVGENPAVLLGVWTGGVEPSTATIEKELGPLKSTLPAGMDLALVGDLSREPSHLIELRFPPGTGPQELRRVAEQIMRRMPPQPHSRSVGYSDGATFRIQVRSAPPRLDAAELRKGIGDLPGVSIRIGEVGGENSRSAFPVGVALVGPDPEVLQAWAAATTARLRNDGAGVEPEAHVAVGAPKLQIAIDRERAVKLDVAMPELASAVKLATGGSFRIRRPNGRQLQVRLEVAGTADDPSAGLLVRTRGKELTPLSGLVNATVAKQPSVLLRVEGEPAIRISASPPSGTKAAAASKCMAAAATERQNLKLTAEYRAIDITHAD